MTRSRGSLEDEWLGRIEPALRPDERVTHLLWSTWGPTLSFYLGSWGEILLQKQHAVFVTSERRFGLCTLSPVGAKPKKVVGVWEPSDVRVVRTFRRRTPQEVGVEVRAGDQTFLLAFSNDQTPEAQRFIDAVGAV